MIHKMNLQHTPFEKIKEKTKTIEMRLYDEKRSAIAVGDSIVFTDITNGEEILCLVTNLYRYSNFVNLYEHHSKLALGYTPNEPACASDMLQYYSEEKIAQYGVIGIEICVI